MHTLQKKIGELHAIAGELPAIVIIQDLASGKVEYASPTGADKLLHPKDLADLQPQVAEMLQKNDESQFVTFFHQVRPSEQHDWSWYLGAQKIFLKDSGDKPTHVIIYASAVDPMHHITSKVNRLLEENNFLHRYQKVFTSLTGREKEILRLAALGETAENIALALSISKKTAQTHRRNIKAKLKAQSNYDITKFAQAFDLI